jgi:hypothetical protein
MVTWKIALASYFAVGLVVVFVGPAARLRRHEQEKLRCQAHDQPWQQIVFSYGIAIGIIILWPVLIASAARTEAASEIDFDLLNLRPVEPSAALDHSISDIQNRYSSSLPLEEYRKIVSRLPWTDRERFDSRLAQLGYAVTGFATDPQGQNLAVAVPVLRIGMPFALTRLRGRADSLPAQRRVAQDVGELKEKRHADPPRRGRPYRAATKYFSIHSIMAFRSGFRRSQMMRFGNFRLRRTAGRI